MVECHRGLGHVALDAPAIVSGVLSVSAVHAQRRVRTAARLAADGPPGRPPRRGWVGCTRRWRRVGWTPTGPGWSPRSSSTPPPQVAATVVAALEGHFDTEDGAHLRRRCRRVLTRISPDLLHQRAARARAQCGLRRWADEPGVDRWEGTFPSEEAARAWAAIDALARQYVSRRRLPGHRTRPGQGVDRPGRRQRHHRHDHHPHRPSRRRPGHRRPATASRPPPSPSLTPLSRSPLYPAPPSRRPLRSASPTPGRRGCHRSAPETMSRVTGRQTPQTLGETPENSVGTGDRRGCPGRGHRPRRRGAGAGLPPLARRHDRRRRPTVQVASCHPVTGALLDERDGEAARGVAAATASLARPDPLSPGGWVAAAAGFGADPYRPSTRMAKRIRARDRRCRFPGCSIAAVFCDLDHVRPWPHGRTRDDNLLCLCRRHHRVKQRPGWQVTLTPDAIATWTDPTGRTRTTHPVDALRTTILTGTTGMRHRHRHRQPARPARPALASTRRRPPRRPAAPAEPAPSSPTARTARSSSSSNTTAPPHRATHRHEHQSTVWRDDHGRRHRTDLLPPTGTLVIDHHAWPGWRERHPRQYRDTDLPPF